MKIGTPIFFNYVGYHQGKDLTMKEKDYFSSFQWKNALPSGAKVYWNNITCLCKQFIVVSITICVVMSLVVKMLFTPLHDTSEYISFQTFRKNVYVYFLVCLHIKLNGTTSIWFYEYILPAYNLGRKLRRYKSKVLFSDSFVMAQ